MNSRYLTFATIVREEKVPRRTEARRGTEANVISSVAVSLLEGRISCVGRKQAGRRTDAGGSTEAGKREVGGRTKVVEPIGNRPR
jgi:hypothetical protein